MVSALDRKLLREVRATGAMLIAITSIIAVGVMCFVYMRSAYYNLSLAKFRYYNQCRMADFWIEVKKAPLVDVDRLIDVPGVTAIRPRIQFFATVDLERVIAPLNGLVLSLPDLRKPIINDIVMQSGGYFTDRRANEVIVNSAFARKHGIRPGHTIHLLLNNRRQELHVVGTAISSEFVYLVSPGSLAPDPEHFGVFYIKRTYAEEVFDFEGATNQIVGLLDPAHKETPGEVLRRMEVMLEPYGVATSYGLRTQTSNQFLSDEIQGLGVFSTIMPAIFLAVAALVLNVLMIRLIDQQRTIIGTLKALGYYDSQIFLHYTKFAMAVGLFASLIGLGLGYAMSHFVLSIYKMFYEFPSLENHIFPGTYLGGVAVAVLCALIGSLQAARLGLSLKPAEAMRPKPPPQGGEIWLEHFSGFWSRLSFGWRLVLRNVFRHKLRTSVGIFATSLGAGLLTCGFILTSAIAFLINFQFELVTRSDVDLHFKDEQGRPALLEAANLPGVSLAEPQFDVSCTFVNGPHRRRGAISGLLPHSQLTTPRDVDGERVRIPSVGLAMSSKLAEILHLRPGDHVTVLPTQGRREELHVPVTALSDSYIGMAVYADIDYLSHLMGEEFAVTGVQLAVDGGELQRNSLYREIKQLPGVQSVNVRADVIRNMEFIVETQRIFIVFVVLFAGVIFFSSLLNSSLVGLAERRREVATFRVLGYNEWQVGGLFLRESLVVNSLGTLLGLPLGYALAWVLARVYDTEMFRFPLVAPTWVWYAAVGMAIVFALTAHAVVQRAINRLDWLDASKTKE
ncbi:MAG: ABC transporter permease [Planctomycetota bacterium]|nr:MAG: ABC transporter permease [Planctomycetota bacterium]